MFSWIKNALNTISFQNYKHWHLIHTWWEKDLKDTLTYETLERQGENLLILLLSEKFLIYF